MIPLQVHGGRESNLAMVRSSDRSGRNPMSFCPRKRAWCGGRADLALKRETILGVMRSDATGKRGMAHAAELVIWRGHEHRVA